MQKKHDFHVGQQVRCVDKAGVSVLIEGNIYIITELEEGYGDGDLRVVLKEWPGAKYKTRRFVAIDEVGMDPVFSLEEIEGARRMVRSYEKKA